MHQMPLENQCGIELYRSATPERFSADNTSGLMIMFSPPIQMVSGQNENLKLHAARKAYDSLADRYAEEPMVR